MYDVLKFDAVRAQTPQFFYKRLDLANRPLDYFIIPIDYGFCFILRSMRFKNSEFMPNGGSSLQSLTVEYIQQIAQRPLQNVPYPARLISTPGSGGVTANASPNPVDLDNFGMNFSCVRPPLNNIILNFYYQHRETLDLRVRFSIASGDQLERYVDVLLIGYYIPDQELPDWTKEDKTLKKG